MKSTFKYSKFKNEKDSEQKSTIGSDKARKINKSKFCKLKKPKIKGRN
jgi:hypothetical protein